MVKRQRARWADFIGTAIALVSGCITPPGPILTAETVPHVTANPVPSVYADPVSSSTAVPLPAARAAEPTHGAADAVLPPASSAAEPIHGTVDVDWHAQTLPICPGGVADAGALVPSASTIDWAKLDAGTNPGSAKSASAGAGTVSNVSQVVTGMHAAFRACYQAELRRAPMAAGHVRLVIKVGCDGSVVSVNGVAHDLSKQLAACMIDAVKPTRFDPPEGGSAMIAVPVTFVKR